MPDKSFVTQAINIKNYPLNEFDNIVIMFSKTKGLIKTVAKGVKRPKSKLGARIQMFIANELMLIKGRNLDTIIQAQSLNTFSKIRGNLDKLSYSMYIAQIVDNFCSKENNDEQNSENYENIYNLIYSAYDKIAQADKKEQIILSSLKFQIKLLNILGWGLDFECCSKCQKKLDCDIEKSTLFSYSFGGFFCDNCKDELTGDVIRIHNKIRLFLNEISKADFNQKTKYDDIVNFAVLDRCFLFMKKYIDNLTNKKTKIFEVLEKTRLS